MHHPGPPRFAAVGETVELAPRTPDPAATYRWSLLEKPADSTLEAPVGPVGHVEPDAPGIYRFELEGPAGSASQRLRVFPDVRRQTTFELDRDELPEHDPEDVSIIGPFNDHLAGRDRPQLEDGTYVYDVDLPPGDHRHGFIRDEGSEGDVWTNRTVPGPGRPRIHLDGGVEDDAVVITAATEAGTDSDYGDDELAVEFYVDDRDTLSDTALEVEGTTARLSLTTLDAISEPVRVHAVAVGERHSVADCVAVGPDGAVDRVNDPPEWIRDAVVYEVFVRSFTDEATFESFERRVPYLESLGVDCLWLTPIIESPTTHGYHTTDYFDTASDLGSREAFESFVDRCHEAGIKVVFDLVINHTAREHAHFDLSAAGVEGYADWYVWESLAGSHLSEPDLEGGRDADGPPHRYLPDDGTEVAQYYFNWHGIPNVNYDSLSARAFMLEVIDEWADVVDGYRCDVAWGVPHGFWKEVSDRLNARDSEFLLLDETIPRDPAYAEAEFDVHYDTTLYWTLLEVGKGETPADAILEAVRTPAQEAFPDWSLHMRYIENHDEPRYLDVCGSDAQRAAAAAVLTLPGVPMIYYGQERGATDYRQPMPWEGDGESTAFHRRLVAARRTNPALSRGDLDDLTYDADTDAAVAFTRETDEQRLAVFLHFGDGTATVTVDSVLETTDLVTGEPVTLETDREGTTMRVDDVCVLEIAEPVEDARVSTETDSSSEAERT
ncbi:alpha-amylase family glycosyl hydrolase [Natronosalvus vescus]|uniref:alpha-amylase family glycosyl hydrolase n=1 Tax=Natronosalvus vescus TaxID=2953881 RepID=UPI00208FFCA3|nr:alpha-amylase family glycosyl hydrolase [Natronosalvus vescus]